MPELTPQPTPVQAIYDMYRTDTLIVNRSYQRKLVWTLAEKRKLIDSLLCKYPIPLILLSEAKYAEKPAYEVIDGLQRLHTIISFIEHGFQLDNGKVFDLDQFAAAKNEAADQKFEIKDADRLSPGECAHILNYIISLSVMRDATEAQIQDVFHRINSYGHRLSEQERRQAGLVTRLAKFVRQFACRVRGDDSRDVLTLNEMPAVSIDLPKSKHGFGIEAKNCFWVKHGILRSTDLRDSMDEHLIADIACCIVNGTPIERSIDALDEAFNVSEKLGKSIDGSLVAYGEERLGDEIFFILSEIDKAVLASGNPSLRRLIFKASTTNAYPSVFALICLAFYNHIFKQKKGVVDYAHLGERLNNISESIDTGRSAVVPTQRLKNIDAIFGMVGPCFGRAIIEAEIYGAPSLVEFENILRNSPLENSALEFKQGIARVEEKGQIDNAMKDKILHTICAIANIGPKSSGHLYLGVADKRRDADRIANIDGVVPLAISTRFVVGIDREARRLGKTLDQYFTDFRETIRNSKLSEPLRQSVLSNMKMINYHGRAVLDIGIAPQPQLSFHDEKAYFREADQTKLAGIMQTVTLANRFR